MWFNSFFHFGFVFFCFSIFDGWAPPLPPAEGFSVLSSSTHSLVSISELRMDGRIFEKEKNTQIVVSVTDGRISGMSSLSVSIVSSKIDRNKWRLNTTTKGSSALYAKSDGSVENKQRTSFRLRFPSGCTSRAGIWFALKFLTPVLLCAYRF